MDELRSTVTTQPQAASPRPDATNQHSSKKSQAQRKKSLRRGDLHNAQRDNAVPSATREKEMCQVLERYGELYVLLQRLLYLQQLEN